LSKTTEPQITSETQEWGLKIKRGIGTVASLVVTTDCKQTSGYA